MMFLQEKKMGRLYHPQIITASQVSGGTTGVQTVHRTGAHGPRGPIQAHTIRQSQYNTPLLSANCLFINGPIINNIFLKIMDTLFRFYS